MHLLTLAGFLLPAPAIPTPQAVPIEAWTPAAPQVIAAAAFAPSAAPIRRAPIPTDGLFAPATEALALAWPAESEGLTLLDIVEAYGRVTDQRLAIQSETKKILAQTSAPIDRTTSVPPAEVQGFVEAMLRSSGCVLTIDRASQPRLVGVHSLSTRGRNEIRNRAINIDSSKIDVLRNHPAVLFATVVDLPNVDVRQMSNSLRTMITDANTSQLLPAGSSNSMIVVGFGTNVADQVEQLRAIDAASEKSKVTVSHELVRLKNATAAGIAPLVESALTVSRELRTPRSNTPQGPQRQSPVKVSVLADGRLNGLLVTCRSEDLEEARAVIAQLDVK